MVITGTTSPATRLGSAGLSAAIWGSEVNELTFAARATDRSSDRYLDDAARRRSEVVARAILDDPTRTSPIRGREAL